MAGIEEELEREISALNGRFARGFITNANRQNPVDTGLSRSGWHITFRPNQNRQFPILPPAAVNVQAALFARGNLTRTFFMLNNVEYIEPLLEGHSPQASRGWMDRILMRELNDVFGVG